MKKQQAAKTQIYQTGGCYCKICDYYFKENYPRCPCCNNATRQRPRSNKRFAVSRI